MKSTTKRILSVLSVTLMSCLLLAGCMPATTGDAAASGDSTAATIQMVVSIVVLFAVFYFFMIRPERKRRKEAETMRSSLGVGDKIVTIGGIVGKIVSVNDDNIVFETGEDRVRVEIAKWAISRKQK